MVLHGIAAAASVALELSVTDSWQQLQFKGPFQYFMLDVIER
jgi:hypothetical protein